MMLNDELIDDRIYVLAMYSWDLTLEWWSLLSMVEERGRFSIDEVFEMVEHWYFEIGRAKFDYMTVVQTKFMIELREKTNTEFSFTFIWTERTEVIWISWCASVTKWIECKNIK